MTNIFFLIVGMVGLWIGSELIVRGATTVSKRYHLKESFIGVSVLAFGTDLPEFAVMLDASFLPTSPESGSGIILGSAIGSAIGQISLVLGIVGVIGTLSLRRRHILQYGSILCGAILLLFLFSINGIISRIEGAILVLCYVGFFVILLKKMKTENIPEEGQLPVSATIAWLMIIPGLILLLGNAKLTVMAALSLAQDFGYSSSAVAIVIIGLGSSMPELSLSGLALMKKKAGLSIGNLIGSNILDTLLIPGIGACIKPLVTEVEITWFDIPFLLIVTLFALYALSSSRVGLRLHHAIFLILIYLLYIIIRFGREVL